jgi:apolipoprotein N-acyltransferase
MSSSPTTITLAAPAPRSQVKEESRTRVWSAGASCALAVLSGVLITLAIAEFDIWAFAWFGLAPLMLAVERSQRLRHAFLLGWLMGLVTNLGGLAWIIGLLERYDALPRAWSVLVYVLFCAYQGLVFALFTLVLKRLRTGLAVRGHALPLIVLAPLTMAAAELVLPFVFPWNLAMTQAWLPRVIQLAELTGPTGVSALLMVSNGALCDGLLARRRRWTSPLVGLAVVALALGYGELRIAQVEALEAQAPKLSVGVVQASVGFAEHGRDHRELAARQLTRLQELSRELDRAGAELILWTETVYPYALPQSLSEDLPEQVPQRIRRGFRAPLIFGASSYDPSVGPAGMLRNSAFMLEPFGNIAGRYDKNELVAFGERVPFEHRLPALQALRLASAGQYEPGSEVTSFPFGKDGQSFRIAPMICLEDIFPALGRRVGELHPHLLVNLTNDAWFGPTSESAQHLALAVFRSVEQRVAMVRAVNTGPSAFISATGRVLSRSERMRSLDALPPPQGLRGELALLEGGHTLFAALGPVFAQACMLLVLAGLTLAQLRSRSSAARLRGRPRVHA